MGYDIVAYFDTDQSVQDELDAFVQQNKINKNKFDSSQKIADFYKEKYLPADWVHEVLYEWNKRCGFHELCSSQGTNFIRDDERFNNARYQKLLESRVGQPFPWQLSSINHNLSRKKDALEIAKQLRIFFKDDSGLLQFADWCEDTAKYCSSYELSY